jgi:gustatory receptor
LILTFKIIPAIYAGKVFLLFPINVTSTQPYEVIFKWKSIKSIICTMHVLMLVATFCFHLKFQLANGPITPSSAVGLIFFVVVNLICFSFFKLSLRWRYLMTHWTRIEKIFITEKYRMPSKMWSLRKQLAVVTFTYLLLSMTEHILFQAADNYKLIYEIQHCNFTYDSYLEVFIKKHLEIVLTNLPFSYNNFLGLLLEYLNVSYTFLWNFLDLFIILLSTGISYVFDRINNRLKNILQNIQEINEDLWVELREHHVKACELIGIVNQTVDTIIILAFANDGYFMLIQMLNITKLN